VAVDGVCLTVERATPRGFEATAVPETLRLTTLGRLRAGARVNLERALRYGDLVGGHLVQGHVDALGRVRAWKGGRRERRLVVAAPRSVRRDLVHKGSIAVNGVSLTVAALGRAGLEVALVPHTLAVTNLSGLRVGDPVNLEVDLYTRTLRSLLSQLRARRRLRSRRRRSAREGV
jgi:riboflavin synthase